MWWIAGALAADCVRHTTTAELVEDLASAETGLESGDAVRFRDGVARLEQTVKCVYEPVSPDDMARYRVVVGVERFGGSDLDAAASSFLAGRAVSSDVRIPLYPDDHEIYGVFRRYDPVRSERVRLPAPRRGSLLLDGLQTRDRYTAAPVFAQLVVDGQVVSADELAPGQLPSYPVRHPVRNGMIATTGGLAVASTSFLLASGATKKSFYNGDHDYAALTSLRARNNLFAGTGLALASATVVSGAITFLVRDR
ncbi:MAG: hypothetical protein H6737_06725 [Alphaproteobacteria bacterium]|nr:hypothetical protein [Alphaproteobacteria bacterium]